VNVSVPNPKFARPCCVYLWSQLKSISDEQFFRGYAVCTAPAIWATRFEREEAKKNPGGQARRGRSN